MKRSYMVLVAFVVLVLSYLDPGLVLGAGMIGLAGTIIDAHNLYSDAQALSATAVSTNIIDHGSARDLGDGEPMCFVVTLDVASDGTTGDETYTVQMQTDDNAAFSSATAVGPAYTIPRSSVAGTNFICPLPPGVAVERFTRLNYTLGGTTPLATVTSFLQPLNMASRLGGPKFYADAITISS